MRGTIAVAALLAACGTGGSGPRTAYLQDGTDHAVTVVWRSSDPGVGRVAWGTDPAHLDHVASGGGPTRDHRVRLEDLPSGARIYYAYGQRAALNANAGQHYDVAPPPGADATLRFWVLGDSGTGGAAQRAVFGAMRREGDVDFLVHVGDVAYDSGTGHELDAHYFDVYREMLQGLVAWPTLGNHDVKSVNVLANRGPYFDAFVLPAAGEAGGVPSGTEAYYAFDHGPAHFVVLDSAWDPMQRGNAMLAWLERDLAANRAKWTIAVFHHPPYSKGTHDSDVEARMIAVREHVVPILEAHGVDLVLSGHSHAYERTALIDGAYETPSIADAHVLDAAPPYEKSPGPHGGTIYVVAGHGGARTGGQLDHPLVAAASAAHGALLVEIDGDELRGRNVRADGGPGDTFTLIER